MLKKCPYCAEDIQQEAVKCKHCGEFLEKRAKVKWYRNSGSILMTFIVVGPLALPLVWTHPTYSRRIKIILTMIMLALTWFAVKIVHSTYENINEQFKTLY